jgi:TetR/AcrR family tetracycline transcriptional repressor
MARPRQVIKRQVAEVAIRIIDDEGLGALSVERIANELGVRGPSLYYYYADKAAILEAVASRVLGGLTLNRVADDWIDWLVDVSVDFYRCVMQHPNAATLLIEYLPSHSIHDGFGRAAEQLTAAGVDPTLQMTLLEGAQHMTWGFAIYYASIVTRQPVGERPGSQHWPALEAAERARPWHHEELLEHSIRSFIAGVLQRAGEPVERTA